MTTTVYPPLTHAEQIFKDLIWLPMIKAGETWIEAQAPVLALPILKELDEGTLNAIANLVFEQLILFIDVTAISLVNPLHQAAYDNASLMLKIIAIDKGVSSAEYIATRDKALTAMASFTQFANISH